jgi:hypothetical protein
VHIKILLFFSEKFFSKKNDFGCKYYRVYGLEKEHQRHQSLFVEEIGPIPIATHCVVALPIIDGCSKDVKLCPCDQSFVPR